MITELSSVLAGKSGVMAQWYQRHAFFMALEEVRRGVGSTHMPEARSAAMANHAVDRLLIAVDKESREETRAVGLGCLTRWTLMLDTIPPKLLASLKNGLVSTARPTATMSAAAACELSGCSRLSVQLVPLLPHLLGRVDTAAKKPNVFHPDAIYSSNAVLQVAAADDASADSVNDAYPWYALKDQGSFLFPAGVLAPHYADVSLVGEAAGPLAPHVCAALCHVLFLAAGFVVRQSKDDVLPFPEASSLALVQCMVLPSPEVRRVASEAASGVCNLVGGAQAALLRSCHQVRGFDMHLTGVSQLCLWALPRW